MKFDDSRLVEQIVWDMRLADLPRSTDRDILNRTYNGEPPFDKATAEQNNVEVNRNFLEGTGNLTDARTQWNNNFLKPGDRFTVRVDCPEPNDRQKYSSSITKRINRALKTDIGMINNTRETGAATLLHGIGPSNWDDRRGPVPKTIPIPSLMIPSETDIDFSNLEYFAIFREMTPAQLYQKTHGPKVDPGWNMPLVMSELKYVAEQTVKQPNATAFQFMPERISELIKQDGGFWGSDAVPTIDYWDFYFREKEDGDGWYRRIFLDWASGGRQVPIGGKTPNSSPNRDSKDQGQWLYTSKGKCYAKSWQEIIHCNFGDCSCVAPFKYHSVRSLGWMIWGIVDIMNRMHCKATEQAFSDLMWFFRVASNNEMTRLKKANFLQMGIIPQGIEWVKAQERFSPNPTFLELVMGENRRLMVQHSASYTRAGERGAADKEKTATEVMAEVNSINTLVSGVMNMAYTYESFKYQEICRRFCIPNNPYPMVKKFRKGCLEDGVPAKYLDIDTWEIEPERAMGQGNRTVQMAIVQYLNQVRQNLGPEGQRLVDHMGILIMTEDSRMAQDLAPVDENQPISRSMHDAELSTERLMAGLPFTPTPQMIYEDYVIVWLRDMAIKVQQIQSTDGMGTPEQLMGLQNMAQHIGQFLQLIASSDEAKPKVRQYGDMLGQLMNQVKAFGQRLQQKMQAGNGQGGTVAAETQAKLQGKLMIDQAKAQNMRESHSQRTAQRQVQFEMEQQRKDRESAAEMRRKNAESNRDLTAGTLKVLQEMNHNRLKSLSD